MASAAARTVRTRQTRLAPMYGMFQTYQNPFIATRASMQYMYDQDDREHLDLLVRSPPVRRATQTSL